MFDSLLQLFNSVIPVSNGLKERLISLLRIETFPKKTVLLKEGQIRNYIYFIEKGLSCPFGHSGGILYNALEGTFVNVKTK